MTTMVRRPAPVFPEVFSFLDNVWPFTDFGSIRVESYMDDGRFLLRAELPGIDPTRDAEITVDHGRLTVIARREQRHEGSAAQRVPLRLVQPVGAKVERTTATYEDGILVVTVPVDTVGQDTPTKIEITNGKDTRKK